MREGRLCADEDLSDGGDASLASKNRRGRAADESRGDGGCVMLSDWTFEESFEDDGGEIGEYRSGVSRREPVGVAYGSGVGPREDDPPTSGDVAPVSYTHLTLPTKA